MATERVRNGSRGEARPAESLVQIISVVGARRRELKASVGERLRLLDVRASASEARHAELVERLAGLERQLERLDRARSAQSERSGLRRPAGARLHRLGAALLYVGGLVVLWVGLLELGLALGLS